MRSANARSSAELAPRSVRNSLAEFVVFLLAFAGDYGLLTGQAVLDSVESGGAGVLRSGRVLRVGSVGDHLGCGHGCSTLLANYESIRVWGWVV